jgi:hypothetical protein
MSINAPTYPHLDPAIRDLADQEDIVRVQCLLKEIFIYHPSVLRIERLLEHFYRVPRRYRSTGMFICSLSGMGKTQLLRAFERKYAEQIDPAGRGRRLPVLYVEMLEYPTPYGMDVELFTQAGLPRPSASRFIPLHELLRDGLSKLGTRLVLIDEIHNLCNARRPEVMCTWIRMLSNRLQIPIVLSGNDMFLPCLNDFQMSSRWPFTVEIPLWQEGADFEALLYAWERALPLRLPSRLTSRELSRALLKESEGITDVIARCLSAAAIAAIRLKREAITKDLLSWWRDPPMLDGVADDPESLARGWLSDDRDQPEPIAAFTVRGVRKQRLHVRSSGHADDVAH